MLLLIFYIYIYMDNNKNNISETINNLYNKVSYLERYGKDILFSLLIIVILIVWTSYYYVRNHIEPIKKNWESNRCNPIYMPFASMINGDKKKTALQFNQENFSSCIQNILTGVADSAFEPIYYLLKILSSLGQLVSNTLNSLRNIINKTRKATANVGENVMGRTLNVINPIIKLLINTKSFFGKLTAVMLTTIYTSLGSILTIKSSINVVIKNIVKLILLPAIAAIFITIAIPFIGWGIAVPMIAVYITIASLMVSLGAWGSRVTGAEFIKIPKAPCFDKDTKIVLINRETKKISDIVIGDVIVDGSVVTGVVKIHKNNHKMYNLNNIYVTGNHKVYHNDIGWIKVEKHPDSILVDNYKEDIVYDLNTSTKTININNNIFADWDDLDDMDLMSLRSNCRTLPNKFKKQDIHTFLDNGLHEDTTIQLKDNSKVTIKDIKIGSITSNGEKIVGKIQIYSKDLNKVNKYILDGISIIASDNIQFQNSNLGNIKINKIENPEYLYHVITNTGIINIHGVKLCDYNAGIENYLDNI